MRSRAFIKNTEANIEIHALKQDLKANTKFKVATICSIRNEHQEKSSFYSRDHGRPQPDKGCGGDPQAAKERTQYPAKSQGELKELLLLWENGSHQNQNVRNVLPTKNRTPNQTAMMETMATKVGETKEKNP